MKKLIRSEHEDASGFALATQEEWDECLARLEDVEFPFVWYSGHEEIHFHNKKELLDDTHVKDLTDEEGFLLETIFELKPYAFCFPKIQYGHFPNQIFDKD